MSDQPTPAAHVYEIHYFTLDSRPTPARRLFATEEAALAAADRFAHAEYGDRYIQEWRHGIDPGRPWTLDLKPQSDHGNPHYRDSLTVRAIPVEEGSVVTLPGGPVRRDMTIIAVTDPGTSHIEHAGGYDEIELTSVTVSGVDQERTHDEPRGRIDRWVLIDARAPGADGEERAYAQLTLSREDAVKLATALRVAAEAEIAPTFP